jgi:hypothetical protein
VYEDSRLARAPTRNCKATRVKFDLFGIPHGVALKVRKA